MKYFLQFLIAGSVFSVESLSLNLANLDEELPDIPGENYSISKIDNQNLDNVHDFQPFADPNESLKIFQNINSLKYLDDSVRKFDNFYQDGEEGFKHVTSRYGKPTAQFHLIQEETEIVNADKKNNKTEENDTEELDAMLVDLQNQTNQMRKYLESLCRKRHSISKKFENDENIPTSFVTSNDPKKISIL